MTFDERVAAVPGRGSYRQKLYTLLGTEKKLPTLRSDRLGEDVELVCRDLDGWWKPRFILDHHSHLAKEIMGEDCRWTVFTVKDIDTDSLEALPEDIRSRAMAMDGRYPTFIHNFRNGVAEVTWTLSPGPGYSADTEESPEVKLHAFVDRNLHILEPFRYLGGSAGFKEYCAMRERAVHAVAEAAVRKPRRIKGKASPRGSR